MIISSIVLFFRRDWAGGVGPAVEAPRPAPAVAPVVPAVAPVVEGPVVEVVGAVIAGLLSAVVVAPAPAEVLAGCVEGVVSAGLLPNNPPVAAGWVLGAEVAAVPGVLVAVDLAAPRPENKPPPAGGAAAGVAEGLDEGVVPPRLNSGLAGVVVDVAGVVEDTLVVVVVVGGLKSDDVCAPCTPAGVAVAPPKRGLGALSALVVAGVVDSAGLSLFKLPKRPPPVGAAGVEPNNVFCCVFPRRPPPNCGCDAPPNAGVVEEVVTVVVVDGVNDEVVLVFAFPKRPPGFCAVWPKRDCWPVPLCGGGPAGVVEVFPKRPPPDGAGVAVFPNKPPVGFGASPNRPPLLFCPDVGASLALGVVDPLPNNPDD